MDTVTEEELAEALEKNRRYAYHIGGNLGPDLESAGREAIVKAMQTYDRSKGRFATYAFWFIRKFQIRERKELLTAVHLPANTYTDAPCVGLELIAELAAEEPEEKDYTSLYAAISKLDQKNRRLIEDYYFKENTFRQMGAKRGIAHVTARKYLRTAEAELAKRL